MKYPWYGNVRELKNITEQIAVIEESRTITRAILQNYLNYVPEETLPAMYAGQRTGMISDRELLLKALSMGQMINEMRSEINDLRHVVSQLAASIPGNAGQHMAISGQPTTVSGQQSAVIMSDNHSQKIFNMPHVQPIASSNGENGVPGNYKIQNPKYEIPSDEEFQPSEIIEDEPLALEDRERAAIEKALQRHSGNRRKAAEDLHISQRTLYRKLNEYGLM